jgi:catechol 2,3-dioxygenase-like lactoylglutathione lyase family enzyme
MRVKKISTNLHVDDIDRAREFWADWMGLREEEFNLGWVARFTDPDSGAHVQLVTRDATAPEDSALSVHVEDVEDAYAEAQQRGYEIVLPLRDETWGVRRFFVRSPDGTLLNVVQHRGEG